MLALIIMPVLLVNVAIVTNLAGGFNNWDDLEPHILTVVARPPSMVLGVRNETGVFRFLVNNKFYLPLVDTRVTLEVPPPHLQAGFPTQTLNADCSPVKGTGFQELSHGMSVSVHGHKLTIAVNF